MNFIYIVVLMKQMMVQNSLQGLILLSGKWTVMKWAGAFMKGGGIRKALWKEREEEIEFLLGSL